MTDAAETNTETNIAAREATAWCAGLPLVGEEDLNPDERKTLASWQVEARRSAVTHLLLGLTPIAAFGVFHRLAMFSPSMFALVVSFVSPFVLIKAGQQWMAARRHRRELASGRVLRFAGLGAKQEVGFVDLYHRKLIKSGLLKPYDGEMQTLAVLPGSQTVLSANGAPGRRDARVEVVQVAPAPRSSFQVPLPRWVITNKAAPVDVTRRRLNPGEIAELTGKVEQLRRLSGGFFVLTALTGVVFMLWQHNGYPVPPQPATQLIPMGLWVYSVYEVLRNQIRGMRLARDLALGWVVTVEPKPESPEIGDAATAPPSASEFLLVSRFAWTSNGVPAPWRGSRFFATLLIDRRP